MKNIKLFTIGCAAILVFLIVFDITGVLRIRIFSRTVSVAKSMNKIEKIIEVEELITTEYYGEVFTTLADAYDALYPELPGFYREIRDSLLMFRNDSSFFKFNEDTCRSILGNFMGENRFKFRMIWGLKEWDNVKPITYMQMKPTAFRMIRGVMQWKAVDIEDVRMGLILKGLLKNSKKDLDQAVYNRPAKKRAKAIRDHIDNVKRKNHLKWIARGKVRASFDFNPIKDSLTVHHKRNYSNQDTTYIHAGEIEPTILATINPWFIYDPEHKEKNQGYYVIDDNLQGDSGTVSGFDNDQFRRTQMLMEYTERMLRDQAIQLGVEDRAREALKNTLSGFFELITGKPVVIVTDEGGLASSETD